MIARPSPHFTAQAAPAEVIAVHGVFLGGGNTKGESLFFLLLCKVESFLAIRCSTDWDCARFQGKKEKKEGRREGREGGKEEQWRDRHTL